MLVFYTDFLVPDKSAGCARGPFIFIRPKYKHDIGLLKHEQEHVKQWLMTLGFHGLLYLLFDKYKLWAEVQAYKKQSLYYEQDRLELFAEYIANDYKLDITPKAALDKLRSI
jgi:hypothetical protein